MKFIVFNLAVGGALIYLFAANGPELERAAVRIHGAASEIKSRTWESFDDATSADKRSDEMAKRAKEGSSSLVSPAVAATSTEPGGTGRDVTKTSDVNRADPQTVTEPAKPAVAQAAPTPTETPVPAPKDTASSAVPSAPKQPSKAPPAPPAKPAGKKTSLAASLPPVSEPAVAKRRKEILRGIEPEGPRLVLKKGENLMSADERRKRLFSLAEEMELLYARSLSR